MGRFLNQDGSKLRVAGCLGELEQRRHLTHKMPHRSAPKRGSREFGSGANVQK